MQPIHSRFERQTRLQVTRGLYLLRYVSAVETVSPPAGWASVPPNFQESVRLISAPGDVPNRLEYPGSSLVLLAEGPGEITIDLRSRSVDAPLEAEFRLEPLGNQARDNAPNLAAAASPTVKSPVASAGPVVENSAIGSGARRRLVAHIAGRGDVAFEFGDWVGGPEAPCQIEGIQLSSSELDPFLEVQALPAGSGAVWTPWCKNGEFAGTRQQARPLIGLRFRLNEAGQRQYSLAGDALFLSHPAVKASGTRIEFVSPNHRDPLIGIRFAVVSISTSRAGDDRRSASESPGRQEERRIRVYRSSLAS